MKRLLSLLVVIAMVVSMIPNVFAAKEDVDFDELTGRLVVLEDISYFEVVLAEGSDGMIYQWTPDANYNLSLSYTAPEGTEIAVTVTQGEASAVAADGAVSMDVWAEQVVEIEVSEAAALAAEFTISGVANSVPGSDEDNGIFLGQMVNTVTAAGTTFSGNTTWYQGFFSGTVMTINGTGAYNVIYNGETIAAVDGVVSTAVATANPRMPVVFAIDTVGEYTISFAYPAGSQMNPAQLVIGKNTASIAAGDQGYFYTWTATEEGTLTITMPSDMGWTYVINNLTTYIYGDTQWSDSDPVANPAAVEVAAGDEIQLIVNTYDPADEWNNPAGDLVITAAFAEPEPEVTLVITSQPESATKKPGETAIFTVGAEGEGLTYKWQYRNAGTTKWNNTSQPGYNTNTLTIAKLSGSTHNGRQYRCIVTDANGNSVESEPATVTVIYMIDDAKAQSVKIGEIAYFTVNYSIKEGVTYQWQYKGNAKTSKWANTGKTGNKTDTLQVEGLSTNNRYMYRCKITDPNIVDENGTPVPFFSKEVYLNIVEDYAVITKQPESATGVCGNTVTFSVAAEGKGINYQWQWLTANGKTWADTKSKGYNTATLTVKTTDYNDGRQYRCLVRTYNGTAWNIVESEPATLTVLPAADIKVQPVAASGAVGEKVTFHVEAEGEGIIYMWQWAKYPGSWKNTSLEGYNTDTLTVPVTADKNGRYYRCQIVNKYGGIICTEYVQLTVE